MQGTRLVSATLVGTILILIASVNSQAASITWRQDIQKAVDESTRVEKPMLIKFSASWCGYCTKMRRESFSNEQIVEHVNQ